MTPEAFWGTAGAGIISGVAATLLSGGIIWLIAYLRRNSGRSNTAASPPAPSSGPTDGVTASSGSVAIGAVHGGRVNAEIKNVKKRKKTVTSTTNVTNHSAGSSSSKSSDDDWWVLPAALLIATAIVALVFVRWSEYAFLGASILFGLALGGFLATTGWSIAQRTWTPGSALVVAQAAISTIAFICIWTGIQGADIEGWTLSSLRAAVAVATDAVEPSQWSTSIMNSIGGAGIRLAVPLFLAALASVGLACLLGLTMIDWWRYTAALGGRLKKKRAKRALRFAKVDGSAVAGRLVAPLLLAIAGIVAAWVEFDLIGVKG